MKADACGFCAQDQSRLLYPCTDIFGDTFEVRACGSCGAVFLAPRPTAGQLARAYDESYYGEGEEKFEGPVERVLNLFRAQRAARLAARLGYRGRVLDIGCGNGNFLAALGRMGEFELHGIELEGGSAERARRVPGIHLSTAALGPDQFEPGSLDAITLFHVFEHLTAPRETLELIARALRPGGWLVMSFPNIASFQARVFGADWLHLDPPRHLFFFGPRRFRALMHDYGLDVVSEAHFSPEYNPFGFQQSLLNRWLGKRDVLYEHLKGNTQYTAGYLRGSLLAQKLFFVVTFPLFVIVDAVEALFRQGGTVEFVLRRSARPGSPDQNQ